MSVRTLYPRIASVKRGLRVKVQELSIAQTTRLDTLTYPFVASHYCKVFVD